MTDLRTPILKSVARAQATFTPTPGAALVVGTRQAFATRVGPEGVTLHYEDGLEETQPVEALRGRAIARLDLGQPKAPAFLDVARRLAIATSVPADMRATQLVVMSRRAPTPEDAATVRGWAVAVVSGRGVT